MNDYPVTNHFLVEHVQDFNLIIFFEVFIMNYLESLSCFYGISFWWCNKFPFLFWIPFNFLWSLIWVEVFCWKSLFWMYTPWRSLIEVSFMGHKIWRISKSFLHSISSISYSNFLLQEFFDWLDTFLWFERFLFSFLQEFFVENV